MPTERKEDVNSKFHTLFSADGKNIFILGPHFNFSSNNLEIKHEEKFDSKDRKIYQINGNGFINGRNPDLLIEIRNNVFFINGEKMSSSINAVVDADDMVHMGAFIRTFE